LSAGFLRITRKVGEGFTLYVPEGAGPIEMYVSVTDAYKNRAGIAISAPKEVKILRDEIIDRGQKEKAK